jgi:excisionase family DNA binding protein
VARIWAREQPFLFEREIETEVKRMELETLLTPEQLAERLGVPISWVYRHSAPGCCPDQRLPSVKVGRHLRFRREEIQIWLDANSGRACDASDGQEAHPDANSRTLARHRRDFNAKGEVGAHGANGREKSSSSETECEI